MTAKTADLTHHEALTAFRDFVKRVGPKCEFSAGLRGSSYATGPATLQATIWPHGLVGAKAQFDVQSDTYRDLLAACEAQWAERSDTYAANTIREMALAIISLTADLGECTDASLRAKFEAADIARYGDAACAQATEMASNGPFSIVKLTGANDAEAA